MLHLKDIVKQLFPRLQPAAATPVTFMDVLASLRWHVDASGEFNRAVGEIIGALGAIALSSLMRSTYVAVSECKRRLPQDAVIMLPRYCCPSFLHGIKEAGMPYHYCDLDGQTLRIERHHLEAKVNPRVGALLVPNLFGVASDMTALSDYCHEKGWLLVEGADYTFGGSMSGRPFGSFGDLTILNFQEGKALPIGGGMALSKTPFESESTTTDSTVSNLHAFLRSLCYSFLIWPLGYSLFNKFLKVGNISKKRFSMEDTIRDTNSEDDYRLAGRNMLQRISSFQAKLGLRLLGKLDEQIHSRSSVALQLEVGLKEIAEIELIPRHLAIDRCHYLRYPVFVPAGARDALVKFLIKHGFEASPMYVEHGMRIDPHQFPGAARICDQIVTLPCHPLMTHEDGAILPRLVHSFFARG